MAFFVFVVVIVVASDDVKEGVAIHKRAAHTLYFLSSASSLAIFLSTDSALLSTLATQSDRFGGGAFGVPRPNNLFIFTLKTENVNKTPTKRLVITVGSKKKSHNLFLIVEFLVHFVLEAFFMRFDHLLVKSR